MARWSFVIDLNKCNGCESCTANCTQVSSLPPESEWRWVKQVELGQDPIRRRLFMPLSCMHCENPPCRDVCPTGATFQRADGIIGINSASCMGCGYCVVACPYHARAVSERPRCFDFPSAGLILERSPEPGTCTKCDFCLPRIEAGLARGLKPGQDAAATPACAISCLPGAICFGDVDDPQSDISKLLRERKTSRLHEDLGLGPAVHFIVPSLTSWDAKDSSVNLEFIKPVAQNVWRWPAVINFAFGSAGAGFYLVANWFGGLPSAVPALVALSMLAGGFLALTFEAGRPFRARFALKNLRRSWMAREVLTAGLFGILAALALAGGGVYLVLSQIAAAAFIVSQGMILFSSRGIPEWNRPRVPLLFFVSALLGGVGLWLIATMRGRGAGGWTSGLLGAALLISHFYQQHRLIRRNGFLRPIRLSGAARLER